MVEKNYIRLDGMIGEENLQKIDRAIKLCESIVVDGYIERQRRRGIEPKKEWIDEQRILARRYILAQALEMFSSWKEKGDCLPTGIQLGRGNDVFASVVLQKDK